ncbi:MAG: uncharacterized protein KVP18_003983 [Porospora cf. gigantea A]|uniref:uncharacterized protein n=1 Tax=Porospora cf. gigantea A TaxID=2853593 RepID=UPI0035595281|nr:MAG: hypothetical protein KVP18_003983 [Porospora cf. gigantea A]
MRVRFLAAVASARVTFRAPDSFWASTCESYPVHGSLPILSTEVRGRFVPRRSMCEEQAWTEPKSHGSSIALMASCGSAAADIRSVNRIVGGHPDTTAVVLLGAWEDAELTLRYDVVVHRASCAALYGAIDAVRDPRVIIEAALDEDRVLNCDQLAGLQRLGLALAPGWVCLLAVQVVCFRRLPSLASLSFIATTASKLTEIAFGGCLSALCHQWNGIVPLLLLGQTVATNLFVIAAISLVVSLARGRVVLDRTFHELDLLNATLTGCFVYVIVTFREVDARVGIPTLVVAYALVSLEIMKCSRQVMRNLGQRFRLHAVSYAHNEVLKQVVGRYSLFYRLVAWSTAIDFALDTCMRTAAFLTDRLLLSSGARQILDLAWWSLIVLLCLFLCTDSPEMSLLLRVPIDGVESIQPLYITGSAGTDSPRPVSKWTLFWRDACCPGIVQLVPPSHVDEYVLIENPYQEKPMLGRVLPPLSAEPSCCQP